LLLKLDLHDDDRVGREVARGRTVAYRAALASLDGDSSQLAAALRVELRAALAQSDGGNGQDGGSAPSDRLRLRAAGAARHAILAMRSSGEIGDDAFHRLEQQIDRIELSATR
jgi:CPA1 family monovalent cation:H+ antiporter